jgi:type I restriction enzyme, S subunit
MDKKMNVIEKLIAELCPKGVEYRKFGKVAEYIRGVTYSKSNESRDADGYKVLRANNITLSSNKLNFDDVKVISKDVRVKENQKLKKDDILICAASGSKEHIGKVAYIYEDIDYCFGGFMAVVRTCNVLMGRFMFHLLIGENFSKYLESALNTTTINNLSLTILNNFYIPIPPLSIQQAIVKILDTFTTREAELEAELKAELEARKKQYEYYRSRLFVFNADINSVELKEIANFTQGIQVDVSKQLLEPQDNFVRFLRIVDFVKKDEIPRYIEDPGQRYVKNEGDLVMIRYGASAAGKVFINYAGAIANNMFQIKLRTNIITNKYLYCYLSQTSIYKSLNSSGGTSTMPAITFGQIGAVKIPIPPLSEQERIVAILDKFDALVNDISVGLPAELNARRKQYEYYRNKLLTFKKFPSTGGVAAKG